MTLFKRLAFALKYNMSYDWVVVSPDSGAVRFLEYKDAKKFADEHPEYRLHVFKAVWEGSENES